MDQERETKCLITLTDMTTALSVMGRDRSKGINATLHQHQYGTTARIVAAVAKFQQRMTSDD